MENLKNQFRIIIKSKTINEMFSNITQDIIEFIAFIPIIIMTLSPLYQLIKNFFISYHYTFTINSINQIAGILGIFLLILFIGKNIAEKRKISELIKENKTMMFFIIFSALMIISTVINGFNDYVFHGDRYRNESLFTYLIYFLIYFFCASLIKNGKLKSVAIYTYISGSIVIGIFSIIHVFFTPIEQFSHYMADIERHQLTSIFMQFNHYGYYLLMAILLSSSMFILEKSRTLKILCMFSFILNVVVLIINNTFGCYLACFLAMIFNIIVLHIKERKINKNAVFMLICFIAISCIMTLWYNTIFTNIYTFILDILKIARNSEDAENAGTHRWKLWKYTASYIKEKPVFGFGVEGISQRLDKDTGVDRSHNEFLQYSAFFGIPSAIIYICGVMTVFFEGLKNKSKLDIYTITAIITAFGYLVSSFFGNTMYYTAPFLFIFLGFAFTGNNKIIKNNKGD
ncbi:MAG: O-antigen ligase family protein [Oscillospiraceae bacterium]|nr:O-antigen ligase family protein [Oscillospiraceae bacterium]